MFYKTEYDFFKIKNYKDEKNCIDPSLCSWYKSAYINFQIGAKENKKTEHSPKLLVSRGKNNIPTHA